MFISVQILVGIACTTYLYGINPALAYTAFFTFLGADVIKVDY